MRYGVFLKLQSNEEQIINNLKKNFLKKVIGKNKYFDHKTHITLFCFNSRKDIKMIKNKFLLEIKNRSLSPVKLKSKNIFYKDPLTSLDTITLNIFKSKKLISLQMEIFKIFNLFIINKNKNIFKNQIFNSNQEKYGYPFFGKIWIPHITLGSLDLNINPHLYLLFKNLKFKKYFSIKEISLNIIYKDGKFRKIN